MPFLVRWTGQIKPGVSNALVSQIDLVASFASFTGYKLADADAPDSFDVMAALLGKATTGRQSLVQQSTVLSFRDGNWKYIEPSQGPAVTANTNIETGNNAAASCILQISGPIRVSVRIWPRTPERMREMAARLAEIRSKRPEQTVTGRRRAPFHRPFSRLTFRRAPANQAPRSPATGRSPGC